MNKLKAPEKVCTLLQTLAEMSRLLYLGESERTNKEILRLYNTTWLHFEVIKELIPSPKHITRRKLYGIYLHALTVHAPAQFQMMSLKSCNAEHEDRTRRKAVWTGQGYRYCYIQQKARKYCA